MTFEKYTIFHFLTKKNNFFSHNSNMLSIKISEKCILKRDSKLCMQA